MRNATVTFNEDPQCIIALCSAIAAGLLTLGIAEGHMVAFGASLTLFFSACMIRAFGVTITITPNGVSRRSPFGESRVLWKELEMIEIGPSCRTLLLSGAGRQVWMYRPTLSVAAWFRTRYEEDAEEPLLEYLFELLEQHAIPSRSGWLTPFKTSHG